MLSLTPTLVSVTILPRSMRWNGCSFIWRRRKELIDQYHNSETGVPQPHIKWIFFLFHWDPFNVSRWPTEKSKLLQNWDTHIKSKFCIRRARSSAYLCWCSGPLHNHATVCFFRSRLTQILMNVRRYIKLDKKSKPFNHRAHWCAYPWRPKSLISFFTCCAIRWFVIDSLIIHDFDRKW